MKRLRIQFQAERALFRNFAMPGTDVADSNLAERHRAIYGLLGNMLGFWRDFDDPGKLGLAPSLQDWIDAHNVKVVNIDYPPFPEVRIIGQHRYKSVNTFTMFRESGPKNVTYHWNITMTVDVELDDSGADHLIDAVRRPFGTPYMGQSNCVAQVKLIHA